MGALPQDPSCESFGKPPAKRLGSVQRIILIEECPCIRLGRVPSFGDYPGPCGVRGQQASQEGPCEAVPRDGFTTVADPSSCAARELPYGAPTRRSIRNNIAIAACFKRRRFDYFKMASIRASSCSENSRLFSADTESSICSGRLAPISALVTTSRSEERRVGKGGRYRGAREDEKDR